MPTEESRRNRYGAGISVRPFFRLDGDSVSSSLPLTLVRKEERVKTCFGAIYPDLEQFQFGKPMAGKVFQITVNTLGPGHRDRMLDID